MKTTPVSSFALYTAARQSILQNQRSLVAAQEEVASGRLADPGLALGSRTGRTVSLRQEHARLSTLIDANSTARTRLDTTQVALGGIREQAEAFLGALISAPEGGIGISTLHDRAAAGLQGLIATLNGAIGNQHIFAGINTDAPPITDYFASPPGASKQAVDNAFLTSFGMTQGNPAVGTISGTAMQSFLSGPFAAMFADPQWSANWSGASSQVMESRISATRVENTSVSANEPGFRKLAMGYTMIADLGAEGLGAAAFDTVKDNAIRLISEGINEITAVQGRVGGVQARVTQANDRMSLQIDIFSREITSLESVDPFEAATRVTDLLTRLEAGYALTARLQRLSLLNYL